MTDHQSGKSKERLCVMRADCCTGTQGSHVIMFAPTPADCCHSHFLPIRMILIRSNTLSSCSCDRSFSPHFRPVAGSALPSSLLLLVEEMCACACAGLSVFHPTSLHLGKVRWIDLVMYFYVSHSFCLRRNNYLVCLWASVREEKGVGVSLHLLKAFLKQRRFSLCFWAMFNFYFSFRFT